jgi:hypothetical protein
MGADLQQQKSHEEKEVLIVCNYLLKHAVFKSAASAASQHDTAAAVCVGMSIYVYRYKT